MANCHHSTLGPFAPGLWMLRVGFPGLQNEGWLLPHPSHSQPCPELSLSGASWFVEGAASCSPAPSALLPLCFHSFLPLCRILGQSIPLNNPRHGSELHICALLISLESGV